MAGVTNTDLTTKLDDLEGLKTEKKFETRGSSELGKEAFLKLLVTQLSNQDPLNPQSDQEFIAQLAQFSSLEQMQNMSATLTNTSAYSLVGKDVVVSSTDSVGKTTEVRGTVDAVKMQNGNAQLLIDGKTYSIDDLVQVMDSYYAVKEYLPSVKEQEFEFDTAKPSMINVELDLGSNGYEATSVAVMLNGKYIDSEHMSYDDGVLRISPEAFADVTPGTYTLGFYFDDPYQTSVTDKVKVVVKTAVDHSGDTSGKEDGGTTGNETDESNKTENA